jgi:hypothetical protein
MVDSSFWLVIGSCDIMPESHTKNSLNFCWQGIVCYEKVRILLLLTFFGMFWVTIIFAQS